MLYLPHNRRKYHYVPPPATWADFDLLHTVNPGKSASLVDGESTLAPYHLQPVGETQMFFADYVGKRLYLWGFDEGSAFDLSHLASEYASRSDAISNAHFAEITSTGEKVLYSKPSYGDLYVRPLSTAFDLSTVGAESTTFGSYMNCRVCLSADGLKFVTKPYSGNTPALYTCSSAFGYSSHTYVSAYNFSNYESAVRNKSGISTGSFSWKDFQMSRDGDTMVASATIGDSEVVVRIDFSTPWTLSSGTVASAYVVPSGITGVQAVMVDPFGAKMFLFSTGDNKLHEFTLSP